MSQQKQPRSLSGERPSKSNDASREAQLTRLRALTPLQRMALALELGRRNRELSVRRSVPREVIG